MLRLLRLRAEDALELAELLGGDVGNGCEPETPIAPFVQRKSILNGRTAARGFRGPDKEVHGVKAAMIDDRRDGLPVDGIEPSPGEWKPLIDKFRDRRREVDLAVEPWLDDVLVGCLHIGKMPRLK